jgi:hypothetical protein
MTALDLDAIGDEFLNVCGFCDAGMPSSCTCSERDFRPTMLALVREVERLRAVMVEVAESMSRSAENWGEEREDVRAWADRLRAAVNA